MVSFSAVFVLRREVKRFGDNCPHAQLSVIGFCWLRRAQSLFIQAGFMGVAPLGLYSLFNALLKILNKF